MKILLASSEALPYSKTGGLADMVGALAKFLARAGHQVGLVTPLYRGTRERFPDMRPFDWKFDLPFGPDRVDAGVWISELPAGPTVYLIDQPQFFDRSGIYQERGIDYADNAERFIFFSKCVTHLARYLPWRPELVHMHDWPSALVAVFIADQKLRDGWAPAPPTCLTIHNLAYQGNFPAAKFALTNLPQSYFQPENLEFYSGMNCLKGGIIHADMITTVSPRYAREITTELYGCGLDGVLRKRQNVLHGILNGVDYDEWKTEGNPFLPHPFSASNMSGKQMNKAALQQELGLPQAPDIPLFGTISRLAEQKGVNLQLAALQEMLAADMQFVLLGSGNRDYERGYRKLAERYPAKCAVIIGFDTGFSHRIEAGCDFYLMPSHFEPCGLNQMYSLRYGTVPIVRVTGGLDDSVIDISEDERRANGIKFADYSVRALSKAVRKALVLYADKPLLQHYRRNGLACDFSWENTAREYAALYRNLKKL
ncbi:MAG TPA: glycogen synthase GlgA [Candidatus Baltobacteraceae bacterium]|jgi:starch synthase|nr:glycogen synthase GlgA [Candidatus Baltobacteraceae bacterium]